MSSVRFPVNTYVFLLLLLLLLLTSCSSNFVNKLDVFKPNIVIFITCEFTLTCLCID